MKILLTGATGFLGSHIAETLSTHGHELLLAKRTKSDLWRCASLENKVKWTNSDSDTFELDVLSFRPNVIINSAWNGVSAGERNSWKHQLDNLCYQQRLLDLAKRLEVKVFIGIGSQAEYGTFDGCVDENYIADPNTAYGVVKLAAQQIVKTFCEENNITWYWFRLFSCFGEREAENWLIPAVIKNMMSTDQDHMDLTAGEQKYSYLYIKDVTNVILSAVKGNAESGIYHITSDKLRSLKSILVHIKEYLRPEFCLNFGALPYRKNQSMINGSVNLKTRKAFGDFEVSDFSSKLIQTIEYYKAIYNDKR